MAVTGWRFAGTVVQFDTGEGSKIWQPDNNNAAGFGDLTTNISVTSGAYTDSARSLKAGTSSTTLRCYNFGFSSQSIPSGSKIDGIEIEVRKQSTSGGVVDKTIRLMRDSANRTSTAIYDRVGDNKASALAWLINSTVPDTTSGSLFTYGGATDDWTAGLTLSDINDAAFGVDIAVQYSSGSVSYGQLKYLRMRVYYSAGGGGGPTPPSAQAIFIG